MKLIIQHEETPRTPRLASGMAESILAYDYYESRGSACAWSESGYQSMEDARRVKLGIPSIFA